MIYPNLSFSGVYVFNIFYNTRTCGALSLCGPTTVLLIKGDQTIRKISRNLATDRKSDLDMVSHWRILIAFENERFLCMHIAYMVLCYLRSYNGRGFLLSLSLDHYTICTPLSDIDFETLLFSTVSNQCNLSETLHVGDVCCYL